MWIYAHAHLFNGNAPGSTWTTLDLSPWVGATSTAVLIRARPWQAGNVNYAFRTMGENNLYYEAGNGTNDEPLIGSPFTTNEGLVRGQGAGYIMAFTSATGTVEWASSAGASTTLWVHAYEVEATSSGSTLTQNQFETFLTTSMTTTNEFITILGSALVFLAMMSIIMFYFKGKR